MLEKLAFIGAGAMAESVLSGILKEGILPKERIYVTNKHNKDRPEGVRKEYGAVCTTDKQAAVEGADMVILATKPHDLEGAAASIKAYTQPDQLIVSVIAGISTDYISNLLGDGLAVVRTMPNTSASVGRSATAICAGENATDAHVAEVDALFQTIGTTTIVDEADMHTVTGISGSGPAYIYYLVEAMEKAAMDAGLDETVAKEFITQTVIGAGEMLKMSGKPASVLRENITSAGGTTEAGIRTLKRHDFQETVMACVHSARKRSEELGKQR